ncbi:Protein LUTEIN DEFICIENT 5, chloroplastic [Balamuthia mandrillaris]
MTIGLLLDVAIALALIWLFKVFLLHYAYGGDKLREVPGPPPKAFFGNVTELMHDPLQVLSRYRAEYGGIFKYYYFTDPVVAISDPEHVKQILSTKSDNYPKDRDPVIIDVIGNGLLLTNGHFWRRQRKIMSPTFGTLYLKAMVPCFTQVTSVLLQSWEDSLFSNSNGRERLSHSVPSQPFNLHSDMTKVTLDIIGVAGFGYEFNSLTDSEGVIPKAVTTVLSETEYRIFQRRPSWWWKLPLPSNNKFSKAKAVLMREISDMIARRRASGEDLSKSKDLLGRLLAAEDPDTGETISDTQLSDELITFLIAGHETTAASLAFTLYLISQHPHIEKKVLEEVDHVMAGRDEPTFEDLQKLCYLPQVMKESMRLYPPVSMQTTRITAADDRIGSYFIPKGTFIEIYPWLMHRAEELWEDPLSFRPERFAGPPSDYNHKYAPFGQGPRNCIGQGLALLESKVVLCMILNKYTLRMANNHAMTPVLSITLRPDDLVMQLHPRQKL